MRAVDEAPHQLGPYRVIRPLAEGGMGVVYEAEQTAPVRRRVALKVIQEGLNSRDILVRFEAERQALAVMEHPNIARVYDAGVAEGRPYFVMEYVDGMPLTEFCDERRLDTRERVALFLGVCDAVQHAHQKGVLHRDLKPSNILVTEQAGTPAPKVIDFGIAKAIGARLSEATMATAMGALIGTPAYMSPEQAEGSGLDVDTRSDVYALGVVLYELLTGRLPVDPGEIGLLPFLAQLVERTTQPPTPSDLFRGTDANVRQRAERRRSAALTLRRELKGDLDWIVGKALAAERERRYETVHALQGDLQRYLRDEAVLARPPSRGYRLRKFVRRNTAAVVAASAALLALVGGVVAATVGMVRATRAEAQARTEAQTAQQVSAFLINMFQSSDPTRLRGGVITARELLDEGLARVDEELRDEPAVQSRLITTMARAYLFMGQTARAESLFARSHELAERALGPDHVDVGMQLYVRGALRYMAGDYENAERLGTRGLALFERSRDPGASGGIAMLSNHLAGTYLARGDVVRAESLYTRARDILATHPDQDRPRRELFDFTPRERLTAAFSNLGGLYSSTGRYDEALASWQRALELFEQGPDPDHPEVTHLLFPLSLGLSSRGRYTEAEQLARRAVRIRTVAEERPGIWLGRAWLGLGVALRGQGRLAEAESILVASAEAYPAGGGWAHLGTVYLRARNPREAENAYRRAISLTQAGTPGAANLRVWLGDALLIQERYTDAERAFREARDELAGLRPVRFPDDEARADRGLASVFAKTARLDSAEVHYRRALGLQDSLYTAFPEIVERREQLLHTLDELAALLRKSGRATETASLEQRAAAVRRHTTSER